MMKWLEEVDEFSKEGPPLGEAELNGIDVFLSAPMNADELRELTEFCKTAGGIDCSKWSISEFRLPDEYKALLRIADGVSLVNGEREGSFFGRGDLRDYYLRYQFPEYMAEALPIGLNGGGVFYAYDFRNGLDDPPIIAAASGVLDWEDSVVLGGTLEEVFQRSTNIEHELYGGDEGTELDMPLAGDIWLVEKPPGGLRDLFAMKKRLGQSWSAGEMKSWLSADLPVRVIENGQPVAARVRLQNDAPLLECLGYSEPGDRAVTPFTG